MAPRKKNVRNRKVQHERIEEAYTFLQEHPEYSVHRVSMKHGISTSSLYKRRNNLPKEAVMVGRLSVEEEAAICRYINRLEALNLAVRLHFVTSAANNILREKHLPDPFTPVNAKWTSRFIKRHGFSLVAQKRLDLNRQASEDVDRVDEYFGKLKGAIVDYGIHSNDIWNMDETGFRIGVGKEQLVVTKRKRAQYLAVAENRESATAIECISAGGRYTPAFLILAGKKHMSRWSALPQLNEDTVIGVTDTGYTNDEFSFEWLKHFQLHTHRTTTGAKRLLIVDGHGSHHTYEFINYCYEHDIIPFGLPPHLTHILQPLDVVVFQPYKHYHAEALDCLVRDGLTDVTKLDFLSVIEDVRAKTMKHNTIISAFRKSGIHPLDPEVVLAQVRERAARSTPSPPPDDRSQPHIASLMRTPTTYRQFVEMSQYIDEAVDRNIGNNNISPRLVRAIRVFRKGSLIKAAEMVQYHYDFDRSDQAKKARAKAQSVKNRQLTSGGVITVGGSRRMATRKDEDDQEKAVAKAKRLIDAVEKKEQKERVRAEKAAAREARQAAKRA